jgi:hypothetical protein
MDGQMPQDVMMEGTAELIPSVALIVFVFWFLYWIFIPMFCYDF